MRLVCEQDQLLGRLQIAARGASQRPTVQILSGVLLRAGEGDTAELAATDMELAVRVPLGASVAEPGAAVIPARVLVDIVRLLPAQPVSLEQPAGTGLVRIRCGASDYTVHTQSAEDFPHLPEPAGGRFTVDRSAFVETVAHVARAASRDESRPVLTGVLVEFSEGRLTAAATDSYRLSVRETELPGAAGETQAIVPARALAELGRIVAGTTGDLEVAVQENQILFGADGTWLSARRIDGQFPDYRRLRPQSFEHEVTLPRGEIVEVVRRVGLMARHSPLRLQFETGELVVSAQTQDVGEARESMPVDFSGERLEIGFNADFLRDGLEGIEGSDVRLRLISPLRPGLVQGASEESWYLIMPIRLST
jgi:DNA polymerase-3 subunit beta